MAKSIPLSNLAKAIHFCTPREAARGLMFTRPRDRGLVFVFNPPRRIALHMWFVFYRIDVLYLDGAGTILEIVRGFRPFGFYRPRNRASYIVELPKGRADALHPGMQVKGLLPS